MPHQLCLRGKERCIALKRKSVLPFLPSVCAHSQPHPTGWGFSLFGGKTDGANRELRVRHHPVWFVAVMIGLVCLLLLSLTLAVMLGPVSIQPSAVWKIALSHVPFFGDWLEQDWGKPQEQIIWEICLPRVLLGAWLAACGQGERDGSDGSAAAEGVRAPIALETLAKGFYPERFPQSSH